jgi:hypothetical protein
MRTQTPLCAEVVCGWLDVVKYVVFWFNAAQYSRPPRAYLIFKIPETPNPAELSRSGIKEYPWADNTHLA